MAKAKAVSVSTITEFAAVIEEALTTTLANQAGSPYQGNWYRGIGNVAHKLTPTLFRHPKIADAKNLLTLERVMLEHFERQNVLHSGVSGGIGAAAGEDGDFRSLFYMQHYGVPTRLLDWTGNPFIALYFALSSAKQDKHGAFTDDAAVWILDPVAWNKKALELMDHKDRGPLPLNDPSVNGYRPLKLVQGQIVPADFLGVYERPVAMLGISNNARMFAQKGVFTIFGKDTAPMEQQFDKQAFPADTLTQVTVPKAKVGELTERLIAIGYTDSVSYPDLHGLAMEIKRRHGFVV